MSEAVDKMLELVRKTVISIFPELAGRYHLGLNAKVVSTANGLQLQPLTREGANDKTAPEMKCKSVPVTLKPGDIVRVTFQYGDPSEPIVHTLATGVLGTMAGSQIKIEGYGTKPAIIAEYLGDHFRIGTSTVPVDKEGTPLPGAETSGLTRYDILTCLKDGDKVAAVPIEEGEKFIVLAKVVG